ncbi:ABC transporter ATP-binding protein [Globicatella sp. HMSC072A10]|uniref:ABC transporter ATP-binding protein n=1 Tax=Globicatella sp. HMSC072A10 TaxID=1739315 RepID=UPI0008C7C26E|nr:ABC transporter ATP-binding protein [Globicatella sp. HMSC072A10]OFK57590.1 bacteriocin ABC transporter ATP-binding protein [Globicatella sp. HMSC072A10]
MIELVNINKKFGDKTILDNCSFYINPNDFVAIVGESGSGKTTLLNILGLIESVDSGKVKIFDEEHIKPNSIQSNKLIRERISYVFQNFALLDNQTVLYNLLMAMKYRSLKKKEKLLEIEKVLEFVGLGGYQNKKIYELSGGEQQRVAIARAIIKPHDLILADEPTGSLDDVNKQIIFELFEKLNEQGKTIIIVTHDFELAKKCKRILKINSRHQVEEM